MIDADALKDFFSNIQVELSAYRISFKAVNRAIDAMETIDIVFCKECEHYNAGFECLIEGYGIERSPMWFCADGERREP